MVTIFVVKKDAQIRPLTAYMRLLRYAVKLAWTYIKYPDSWWTELGMNSTEYLSAVASIGRDGT
jgi:hypothetical protein